MPNYSDTLNDVFQTLSDPTRRAVLEMLSRGPASTKKLAKPFKMTLPSFMQHLDRLEKSKLVKSEKTGRIRIYHIAPKYLSDAEQWMAKQRTLWESRLDQLDSYLQKMGGDQNE